MFRHCKWSIYINEKKICHYSNSKCALLPSFRCSTEQFDREKWRNNIKRNIFFFRSQFHSIDKYTKLLKRKNQNDRVKIDRDKQTYYDLLRSSRVDGSTSPTHPMQTTTERNTCAQHRHISNDSKGEQFRTRFHKLGSKGFTGWITAGSITRQTTIPFSSVSAGKLAPLLHKFLRVFLFVRTPKQKTLFAW